MEEVQKQKAAKGDRAQSGKSRHQRQIEKLVMENRQLSKQWRKASEEKGEGMTVLTVLRRADHIRKKRRGRRKKDLHVIFLDLATAFGSVQDRRIWSGSDYFRVAEVVGN